MVTIAVSDEGIGIAPEELEGILQPFHGGFARGTGLGLSIVHRIVSDYGGELLVTSQKGQGHDGHGASCRRSSRRRPRDRRSRRRRGIVAASMNHGN